MKQYITVEQMEEIDLKVLRKHICFDESIELLEKVLLYNNHPDYDRLMYDLAKTLNIGHLIEILSKGTPTKMEKSVGWWVWFNEGRSKVNTNELCDALWNAVKYYLE